VEGQREGRGAEAGVTKGENVRTERGRREQRRREALYSTAERGDSVDPVQQGSRARSKARSRASSWDPTFHQGRNGPSAMPSGKVTTRLGVRNAGACETGAKTGASLAREGAGPSSEGGEGARQEQKRVEGEQERGEGSERERKAEGID
jgi:hypothetical protein